MSKLTTFLWFENNDAREAAEFYAATFPDSHVGPAFDASTEFPGGDKGSELVVEFTVLGGAFAGMNGGPHTAPNDAVSFMVTTDDQAETDRYWEAIVGNGGQESACGWCKDRWGFSWQITPRSADGNGRSRPRRRRTRDEGHDDDAPHRYHNDRGRSCRCAGRLT